MTAVEPVTCGRRQTSRRRRCARIGSANGTRNYDKNVARKMNGRSVKMVLSFLAIALLQEFRDDPADPLKFLSMMPGVQSLQTAAPIEFKVPKENVEELKQMIEKNPNFLRDLIRKSNGNPTAALESILGGKRVSGSTQNMPKLPTLPANYPSNKPITVALPKTTMINGQKFVLTTRGNLLWNRGVSLLQKLASPLKNLNKQRVASGISQNQMKSMVEDYLNKDRKKKVLVTEEEDGEYEEEEEEEEEVEEEIEEEEEEEEDNGRERGRRRTRNNKVEEDDDEEEGEGDDEEEDEEEEEKEDKGRRRGRGRGRGRTRKEEDDDEEEEEEEEEEAEEEEEEEEDKGRRRGRGRGRGRRK